MLANESATKLCRGRAKMSAGRIERLQVMLDARELKALDDWRFLKRMPSRSAAVREIIRRGLAAEGFSEAIAGQNSASFGVIDTTGADASSADEPDKPKKNRIEPHP
jgi:hypothetical protein